MKILLCLDSFKGSASSLKINNALKNGLIECNPSLNVKCIEVSDGGEGSVEIIKKYSNYNIREIEVFNSDFTKIKAKYLYNDSVAIIESATACGILNVKELNSLDKSTIGVGMLIRDAISLNVKTIILTVGGTATNDGGIGILNALNIKILDKDKNELSPIASNLENIKYIDDSNKINFDGNFIIASDVDNPLYGKNGATYVYGYQKCNDYNTLEKLEKGMRIYARVINNNKQYLKSMGAGGGIPYGISSFYKTKIVSGFDLVSKFTNLNKYIKDYDVIITGEGKLDNQSLNGKVVGKISNIAKKYNKEILVCCGINNLNSNLNNNIKKVYPLVNKENVTIDDLKNTFENVRQISKMIYKDIISK